MDNNEDDVVDPWEITNGAAGHNSVSRHIVYAGGVTADGRTPKDTRTPEQRKALAEYVRDFHRRFPRCPDRRPQRAGGESLPSFDVKAWLEQIGINR